MKTNYKRFCSLALALCLSAASWAIDVVDGVYQIGTAADMQEFAAAVLENSGAGDAVLTADIDMTEFPEFEISTAAIPYVGTFNGQFHTITVAMEKESECHALFRRLKGATIKNLHVAGTMHAIGKYAAPLVGQSAGADVLENVSTAVDITTTTVGEGAHSCFIGYVLEGSTCTVNNAIVGGSIKGSDTFACGGVCGWSEGSLTLNNVLLTAEFETGVDERPAQGNLTFVRHPDWSKLNNCYYLNAYDVVDAAAKKITAEQLASGEACFILNGSKSEDVAFFQNLTGEVDAMPTLIPTHSVVYLNGRKHCNGDAYTDGVYSNTNSGVIQDDHNFQHGACSYCHIVDENYLTPGEDGFYTLSCVEDLCWFSYMVKAGHGNINGRLTAPADLLDKGFEPIGTVATPFSGKFEGNLHPITNLSTMFFGTVKGATIDGVILQNGVAVGNSTFATHTGALAGFLIGSTVTRCYTGVTVQNGLGDCGGFFGKVQEVSVIKDCMFAGNITCGWSAGCLAGSTNGDSHNVTLSNILIDSRNVTYWNGDAHALLIGWFHAGSSKKTTNIWVVDGADLTDIVGAANRNEQANVLANTHFVSELSNGDVTFGLNNGNMVNPVWFQNLSEENSAPSFDAAEGIVFGFTVDGQTTYTNDFTEFRTYVVDEGEAYLDNLVAYKGDIDTYTEALAAFGASEVWNPAFYTAVLDAKKVLKVSADAYTKLSNRGAEVAQFVEETELYGPAADLLLSYLYDTVEPSEQLPNGSLPYIMENMQLTAEEALAEIDFLNDLREKAVKATYKKGDDITNLLINADLSATPMWTGWETSYQGSKLTTGTVEGIMTTAEAWNATATVKQTLQGLKKGVYELRISAATRPAFNEFNGNDNYIGYIFANDDEVYVQSLGEDMISEMDAIDGVNCHLTGTGVDNSAIIDGVTFYVPCGPVSCAYAFNGGRYVNHVITNVTDGTLTIGMRLPGTGLANDWIGFGNIHLVYLGTEAEAADMMGDGMASYIARANTLINYEGSNASLTESINYKSKPNFSQALREELKKNIEAAAIAATTEDKLGVCARFTELFHAIDTCKAAYIAYLDFANQIFDMSSNDETATDEEILEIANALDEVYAKYCDGEFSLEEAREKALIKNTAYYQRYFAGTPELKNGFYQLAKAADLKWFAEMVNKLSEVKLCGEVVAPIDMTGVDFQPIGVGKRGAFEKGYAGTFKGNLHAITGLTTMFFGTVNGATIDGLNLQGGVISGNSAFADHTGSIAGFVNSGVFTRCYSNATVNGGVGDVGGLFGKVGDANQPAVIISNCMFAGNLAAPSTGACIVGSTGTNYVDVTLSNIFVDARNVTIGNGNNHGLLFGWLHTCENKVSNVWVINGANLTDLVGGGDNNNKAKVAAQTTIVTAEEAASGKVTWGLNCGEETSPVWFQTLGEDALPTLSPDSKIVYLFEGQYTNDDPTAVENIKEGLNNEPQIVNVYDLNGRLLLRGVDSKSGLRSLPNGLYIIGGRKVLK